MGLDLLEQVKDSEDLNFNQVLRILQSNLSEMPTHLMSIERFQAYIRSNQLDSIDEKVIEEVVTALAAIKSKIPDSLNMNKAFEDYSDGIISWIELAITHVDNKMKSLLARKGELTSYKATLMSRINRITRNTYIGSEPIVMGEDPDALPEGIDSNTIGANVEG